jgi:hypothetical protein
MLKEIQITNLKLQCTRRAIKRTLGHRRRKKYAVKILQKPWYSHA